MQPKLPELSQTLSLDLSELTHHFETCATVELSFRPDIPDGEKKYRYRNSQQIVTAFGVTLVLELEDVETGKPIIIDYPEITHIEYDRLSNQFQTKYHIRCLNRRSFYELQYAEWSQELGAKLSDEEFEEMAHIRTFDAYRLIFYPKQV